MSREEESQQDELGGAHIRKSKATKLILGKLVRDSTVPVNRNMPATSNTILELPREDGLTHNIGVVLTFEAENLATAPVSGADSQDWWPPLPPLLPFPFAPVLGQTSAPRSWERHLAQCHTRCTAAAALRAAVAACAVLPTGAQFVATHPSAQHCVGGVCVWVVWEVVPREEFGRTHSCCLL